MFQAVARSGATCRAAAAIIAAVLGGCAASPEYTAQPCPPGYEPAPVAAAPAAVYANPIFLPVADPQCAWETIVDVVNDYFRIQREEPVRVAGNVPIEGTITTFPEVSPTIFEPWRHDTVDPEQRVENTLQTMRRRAVLHVTPAQGGCMVDVAVFKDLESLVPPEHATAGAATFRYDSTLTGVINPIFGQPAMEGWIGRGRDASMEQYLIAHLLSRSGQIATPGVVMRGQDK
ncbi:MAG: hypothetical protein WCB27_21060 [Thermoguttaceae bacterium]